MSMLRWDPFRELHQLRQSMDQLFDEITQGRMRPAESGPTVWQPAVEVYETGDNVVVRAELPGIDPKGIEVTTTDNVVVLRGEAREEKETADRNYIRRELRYGSFARSIQLPVEVDGTNARASYRNGILEVTIPKSVRTKPKAIKVEVE